MKRFLRISGSLIAFVLLVFAVIWWMAYENEPKGDPSNSADQVAEKMMAAVNKPAWDSTTYVQWTFRGEHTFLWDKDRHLVQVDWESNTVLLDINKIAGKAYQAGEELDEKRTAALVQEAWEHFCNDSFWLNAVVKAFDPGTERSLVKLKDGREGLKVSYSQGGVTPGDAYVWILDENSRPTSWKMWVEIIPVGGMEFTWEVWDTLSTGAIIATFHQSDILDLEISGVKAGMDYRDFGLRQDPFAEL
ncbi:MAG: hypothetical protein ACR2MX_10650 [Cyclobacteriaceae bacterium]